MRGDRKPPGENKSPSPSGKARGTGKEKSLKEPRRARIPPKDDRLSTSQRWRQVLRLGEQLIHPFQGSSFNRLIDPGQRTELPGVRIQSDLILATTARLLACQARLWLSREGFPAAILEGEDLFSPDPPTALMRMARQHGEMRCCIVYNSTEHSGESGSADSCSESEPAGCIPGETRQAAAPLLSQHPETRLPLILGVLEAERSVGQPFNAEDLELLEGLATQAAIALQADRQMAIESWRVEQLALVRKVSAQIANVRDLDELARRVTQAIQDTFDYYYVAIFTLEPDQDSLHFRASAGPGLNRDSTAGDTIHIGVGMTGSVAESGQEILAPDVSQEPRFRYSDSLSETSSEVTLPLMIESQILGVLDVQSDQLNAFDETDLLVLRSLAHNIAIAIEGARLYNALRQRAEQLSAISEVSGAITSILDQDELLESVVGLIQKRFGYPFVHVFTVHPGRRKIFYEAGTGLSYSPAPGEDRFAYELDDPKGIIPWVARQAETLLSNDVDSEPRYRPSPLLPDRTRSELAVPLIFGGVVLGVLDVQSERLDAFGDEDRFLFEALADNVAIAMRNAFLYRSEVWRRRVADNMREVAGLLSAGADLDQVLDAILEVLEQTFTTDIAAVWLLDEADDDEPKDAGQLRLAAIKVAEGNPPGIANPEAGGGKPAGVEIGQSLERVLANWEGGGAYARSEVSSQQGQGEVRQGLDSWLTQALEMEDPVVRPSGSQLEPIGAALGFREDYSAIAAPLTAGDQCLGVLMLAHRTPHRYGAEARGLTATLASYAAVAIDNTRLYEAAHEQAWVSTVLLQVSDATQSITSLNELLVTVARITPMLVGVKSCAIYLLEDGDVFTPAAASGLQKEQQAEFERWRFAPGDAPALDQVREEKSSLIQHGQATDERLLAVLSGDSADDGNEEPLFVLTPLSAHGETLGVFVVSYQNGRPAASDPADLQSFFDEQLAILQGIAHQTAVAVENIRLLKAQKEEAYVSVALLQVAQAIVNSNDLEEMLSAIVRITPILVGVKRSVIFLWDEARDRFRLSQSYGLHRAAATMFSPEEFPLLEAVRESDSLIALPAIPDDPTGVGPPASWTQLPAPTPEEVEEALESRSSLLLAFPLSVKGYALGALLVEEPDGVPLAGGLESSSWRRLREKRIEITTGISQQAALAIQNERLQRETVVRERLEREMQLARGIQRAFLPHQAPRLPGWDLSLRWRTAREVGGDFYDLFPLPDGRLGLVIADVADKGMPAALFMTLVRTLVRAAVQMVETPAEVLQRVNDLLVPDAQDGMFITIIYAVLSLEEGSLTYANAGHNPPMLARPKSNVIERLEKGGMALGVLEGNRVAQRTVQLEPGDFLVLYTDGITEAFAPDGSMFGEEGLRAVIQKWTEGPGGERGAPGGELEGAEEILESIDDAVNDFIEDSFLSDDLTMIVLLRMR